MAEAARRQQTTETIAKLYDGKLRLERRNGSPKISARTFLQGKNVVFSTKEQTLPAATKVLDHDQWVKLRKLGKARIDEPDQNPRSKRQRQELYWFLLISVGAALRVGEAYSLRWRDCELIKLNDPDHTEAVHIKVLGKHSRGGKREEAYGMFGAVTAFKAMKAARPDAKPDDPLFTENHREGVKELLAKAELRTEADGRTRDAKSLRQTGISLRLDLGPNPDYRDIAKWARTSPAMIAAFYDQTHPQLSVERIVGFRKRPSGKENQSALAEAAGE